MTQPLDPTPGGVPAAGRRPAVPTWNAIERTDPSGSLAPIDLPLATEAGPEAVPPARPGAGPGGDPGAAPDGPAPTTPGAGTPSPTPAGATPAAASGFDKDGPPTFVPTARPPQRLASPEPPPQQVLTIPWPRVPLNKDSDPRRRVPVGAVITGVLGELLITCGLLLGLYVVWELVWSTVEAKPVQAYALEEVHQRTTYIKPAEPAPGVAYAPEYTENLPEVATCAENQPCYSLHVPRWGDDYDVAIAEGTSDYVLNNGWIGHYTQTQGVGELGNFAVAGHRITHGEPFAKIQALRDGDALIVETDEYYFVYEVYGHEIVLPDEVDVIWPVPREEGAEPLRRLITLTTCHPRYVSTHRYIVWGELSYWTKKSEGPLRALAPEDLRGEG